MSTEPRPKKLLEQVDDAFRLMHYSPRTGETYVHWIRRFILFHDKRHPKEMGAAEVQAFLTYLAIDQNVAASTQNQAFSAAALCLGAQISQRRAERGRQFALPSASLAKDPKPVLSAAGTRESTIQKTVRSPLD